MSTLASDDFAGTGALSGNWTVVDGSLSRASDVLSSPGSAINTARYTGVSAPDNQWAQMTLKTVDTTSDAGTGPAVRFQAGGNMYMIQGNTTETRVYKRVSGVYTQLGTDGPACATNDVLYLEVQGTSIIAKRNGASICGSPISDSAITSGNAGVWSATTITNTADDWSFGDFLSALTDKGTIFKRTYRPCPFAPGNAR